MKAYLQPYTLRTLRQIRDDLFFSSEVRDYLKSDVVSQGDKVSFIELRTNFALATEELEVESLEQIAQALQANSDRLKEGIANLQKSIRDVNRSVEIITALGDLVSFARFILQASKPPV
ncbi:MAG: hypothetical protein H7Y37_06745 [Anaerolineae bacterium]|nr:hypothetical protein [Gloeobacterales cyanobacterium ES-bin-313]